MLSDKGKGVDRDVTPDKTPFDRLAARFGVDLGPHLEVLPAPVMDLFDRIADHLSLVDQVIEISHLNVETTLSHIARRYY